MPVVALTDLTVRALKPGLYLDEKTPSFGIRVGKNRKTWIVIRPNRTKEKFASYPHLSLADARGEAKRLLSTVPEQKPTAILFKKAKELFLEDNYKDAKPRTKHEATRLLKRFPFDERALDAIPDTDIEKELKKLAKTPSEQLHAYRAIRCFFKWCTRPPRRYLRHSPMDGYAPPGKDKKGTRTLTDQELKAIWEASKSPSHIIFRLLILWGTRNSETACMKREWLKEGVLTIPGAHTKNGRPHAIPILPLAEACLDSLTKRGLYVFPSRWGTRDHMDAGSWNKLKNEVQKLSGTSNWQIRDIRRTFRSNMARLKVPRDLCEMLINHAPKVLDEIYDRYDRLEEKREALARLEGHIQKRVS